MKSVFENVDYVKKVIESSSSRAEILRVLGLPVTGALYNKLKKFAEDNSVELPIFARENKPLAIPNSQIFVENSQYLDNRNIKKKLLNSYGWDYVCMVETCEKPNPVWGGKPISLQLDHINGKNNDNRIENLRLICPNCHSQTETFGSRNYAGKNLNPNRYCDCGNSKNISSLFCLECSNHSRISTNTRIEWPEIEKLLQLLAKYNFSQVSKTLGISDNAIRKHLRVRGIDPKTLNNYK